MIVVLKQAKNILMIGLAAVLLLSSIAAIAVAPAPALAQGDEPPQFPSPEPWFDWGQRYINNIVGTPYYTYLKGFGNYEPDLMVGDTPYKVNIYLGPDQSVAQKAYLRAEGNPWAFHWFMKGSWEPGMTEPGVLFDGEMLAFDYPLSLGKSWSDSTTLTHPQYGPLPVTIDVAVVAYIPPDIDELSDIVVADGYSYTLPDLNGNWIPGEEADALAVPLPLRELGDLSWGEMMASADPYLDWEDVLVPAGCQKGQNIQGYYVVKQTINTAGSVTEVEAWKDVRGLVPVQVVNRPGAPTITTMAHRWTGNFDWFEYEFGNPIKSLGIRINDTAIGEGGGSFQFATWSKDFGVKYAGDAMTVDMETGEITIAYTDEYMTCDAWLWRLTDDLWLGMARVKDLSTGRTHRVVGVCPSP